MQGKNHGPSRMISGPGAAFVATRSQHTAHGQDAGACRAHAVNDGSRAMPNVHPGDLVSCASCCRRRFHNISSIDCSMVRAVGHAAVQGATAQSEVSVRQPRSPSSAVGCWPSAHARPRLLGRQSYQPNRQRLGRLLHWRSNLTRRERTALAGLAVHDGLRGGGPGAVSSLALERLFATAAKRTHGAGQVWITLRSEVIGEGGARGFATTASPPSSGDEEVGGSIQQREIQDLAGKPASRGHFDASMATVAAASCWWRAPASGKGPLPKKK